MEELLKSAKRLLDLAAAHPIWTTDDAKLDLAHAINHLQGAVDRAETVRLRDRVDDLEEEIGDLRLRLNIPSSFEPLEANQGARS